MGYEVVEEKPYEDIIQPTCPSCRQGIPFGVGVCPHCGYSLKKGAAVKKVEVKQAAPAKVKKMKKKSRGKVAIAAGSIIVLAALGFLSILYFPPAILLVVLIMAILVSVASG